eukprot:CAMPEP_0177758666 /NCGR_PEP_ID=MMETSP0491_2-20121128/4312_1 /TAXON_ID=63592 /ORGANISM="Tetraselmis chuii, Strain PLY429" /LENGTH=156 /DNA_ID=CAMNT_0019274427 /DNA_START=280 /DNA_END=750 /DNA_ORIENTATION=+
MAQCTEPDVVKYVQRHKIQQLFEALSSLLVTHRPPEPWDFLSQCLDLTITAEKALSARNKERYTFCALLDREAPRPPGEHADGRPMTKLGEKPGNFSKYLSEHHIKEMFEKILEFLITSNLPDHPEEAVLKYCTELAKSQKGRGRQGSMTAIQEGL